MCEMCGCELVLITLCPEFEFTLRETNLSLDGTSSCVVRFEKLQLEGLFKVNEYSLEPKSKLRCQLEDIVVVMQNNLDRC